MSVPALPLSAPASLPLAPGSLGPGSGPGMDEPPLDLDQHLLLEVSRHMEAKEALVSQLKSMNNDAEAGGHCDDQGYSEQFQLDYTQVGGVADGWGQAERGRGRAVLMSERGRAVLKRVAKVARALSSVPAPPTHTNTP